MADKIKLAQALEELGVVQSRSQAVKMINLGLVTVDGNVQMDPTLAISPSAKIDIQNSEIYVSRAGLKLSSAIKKFNLDFKNKVVLDVGSSTGGFTDYSLKHGASKVIAVEIGSNQLHPSLHNNNKIELHEKTDILSMKKLSSSPDIVAIDVSFISVKDILPHISSLVGKKTAIIVMVKPQFEAESGQLMHDGIIKNEKIRRDIFKDFEAWAKPNFLIINKSDSAVSGAKGNLERFYFIRKA